MIAVVQTISFLTVKIRDFIQLKRIINLHSLIIYISIARRNKLIPLYCIELKFTSPFLKIITILSSEGVHGNHSHHRQELRKKPTPCRLSKSVHPFIVQFRLFHPH